MEEQDIPFTVALKRKIDSQMPDAERLIYLFVITFARLEYAFKEIPGFLNQSQIPAKVNWELVEEKIGNTAFHVNMNTPVRLAMKYITDNPPAYRNNVGGSPGWVPNKARRHNIKDTVECILTIRNNLLHGNKFEGNFNENSRNYKLITSALVLMNYIITLHSEIEHAFNDWTV